VELISKIHVVYIETYLKLMVKIVMETIQFVKTRENEIPYRWLDVLDKNNVRVMALDPIHDQKLIKALSTTSKWVIEYEDEDAIFYYREQS